ncbi:hypothetical protein BN1002_00522 [Bacillus sp. B-jedd]|nr:hypothetical protein BN1002_00522 [Bacillus sp. B-jedd]
MISTPGISLSAGHQWSLLVALLLRGLPLLLYPAGVYMPELQSTSYFNLYGVIIKFNLYRITFLPP